MLYRKLLFLCCYIFINNCTTGNTLKNKPYKFIENPFINKGFALIYNNDLYEKKIVSKELDERSLIIFQKNLKKNTKVKITNKINNKSIIATVGTDVNYPSFNNSVLSTRIADELNLTKNEPYIEILEVFEGSVFIAKKAKTFDEEKKVATKAPVNNIIISDLNSSQLSKNDNIDRKFSYIIKVADFYFNDTALMLISRIENQTIIKDAKIKRITEKKYRVYLGPFNNISALKKTFNDINIMKFENLEIIKK